MNMLLRKKANELTRKKKGFTLVELIVVIAIIAILAAMAIPRLGAMRTNARISNDVAAAKNIATVASTLLANGEIAAGTIDVSDTAAANVSAASIRTNLQGSGSNGVPQALTTGHFSVNVATNGDITVSVVTGGTGGSTYQLYPEDTTAKTNYSVAARK